MHTRATPSSTLRIDPTPLEGYEFLGYGQTGDVLRILSQVYGIEANDLSSTCLAPLENFAFFSFSLPCYAHKGNAQFNTQDRPYTIGRIRISGIWPDGRCPSNTFSGVWHRSE
ncbi:hypothetical protein NPIL_390211 [Nephila pilipes]|uniref:Uncharacterized protein n=1 Tax=Nephila pilipes TaxID=299642 RepID=A0A8X6NH27_NEPPI|nr:hypothetical protein NPIL_390211 [Nephila pilipes]